MKDLFSPPAVVVEADALLADLAKQISIAHADALASARTSLEYAQKAGSLLSQAKARLPHGVFMNWVRSNCPFSQRTANGYMRLAGRANELQGQSGIREALEALAEPGEANSQPVANSPPADASSCPCSKLAGQTLESRRELCETWWDIFATYVVLLDASGWEESTISQYLGMPLEDVNLVLHPEPPRRFTNDLDTVRFRDREFRSAFRDYYENRVQYHLLACLASVYQNAAYRASDEGPAVAESRMQLLAEESRKRAIRYRDRSDETGVGESLSRDDWAAAWCCIVSDTRAALGIEPPADSLIVAWAEYSDEIKEQRQG